MSQQYKVLVVDDDLKLRSLLERYLTEQGFVVRGVANGEQADRLLTRENFSLMVLDLMLPGEDGLSICRRLREAGNQIPVLMLTAKGDEVDRIVGLEMGADDYLPKPFNPRELLARIRAVLLRLGLGIDVAAGRHVNQRLGIFTERQLVALDREDELDLIGQQVADLFDGRRQQIVVEGGIGDKLIDHQHGGQKPEHAGEHAAHFLHSPSPSGTNT